MKIGQTLLTCPSSSNLIESNVINSIWNGVDTIECLCDNPDDVMIEKLYKLKCNYSGVFNYELHFGPSIAEINALQNYFVNKLIDKLIAKGCTWAINADDDEFYDAPHSIKAYVNVIDKHEVDWIYTSGYNYYQTELDDESYISSPLNICYRDPEGTMYEYAKPIFRTQNFVSTTLGNHRIVYGKKPILLNVPDIVIRHYTFRDKIYYSDGKAIKLRLNEKDVKEKKLVYDDSFKSKLLTLGFNI